MPASLTMSLRQLEYLVAVAASGTTAAAAQRCQVSQSAVSLAITQLERSLRVQLFVRQPARGMQLTGAGRRVVTDARRLLAQAEDLQASARSLGQDLTGNLVVGCFPTLSPYVVPIALNVFARRHQAVAVDVLEGSIEDLQRSLLSGTCEVALMYDIGLEPGVRAETLYTVRPHVILAAGHPMAAPVVRLADLADEPMVMLDLPPSEGHFRSVFAEAGVEPRVAHRTTTVESVRALVAAGAGYSVLLQRAAHPVSCGGLPLTVCEIEEQVSDTAVQLVTPLPGRLTRRAEAFASLCREHFGTPGTTIPGR